VRTARVATLLGGIAATAVLLYITITAIATHHAASPGSVIAVLCLTAAICWVGLGTCVAVDRLNARADQRVNAAVAAVIAAFDKTLDAYGDRVATDARLAERRDLAALTRPGGRMSVVD
jgi:mannitol-specific phosphotransferase system IIBC component